MARPRASLPVRGVLLARGGESHAAARNLALATVAFALCFSVWGLIAPLAKKFQDDLDLSSTETFFLTAVPVILGSLLRIPVGVLTDRYGGRRMFAALLAFSALPAVLFGYADSYWALVAVGFLLGVAGSSFAVGVPFVAAWYRRERQGFAVGVYGMGNIGTAVAAFSAPAVVNHWGRPALGWIAGIVLLAAAASFGAFAEDAPRRGPRTRYREVLRSGLRLYRLAFFYFLTFGGFVAMALLLPKLLKDWFGYSLVDAGLRAAGFTIVATFARPIGGWLADRVGAYPVLVLAFTGIAVDAAVLASIASDPRIVPVTIASLTLACFLGAGNGAVFKLVPAEFPNDAGAASGIVGAAGGLGGFFPPLFMGIVEDATGTYTLGFVGLLVFTAACLVLALWLLRTAELRGLHASDARGGRPTQTPSRQALGTDDSEPARLDSGDPLFAVDRDLRIVIWNPAVERLTGIPGERAVGRHCWEVLAGLDADGRVVCHAGCSHARRLWEGRPMESPELFVTTARGRRRVAFSTVGVRRGGRPLLVHLMRNLDAEQPEAIRPRAHGGEDPLSARQHRVVELLGEGLRVNEIALRLGISETTVRNHVRAILSRLGCHSQLEAVAEARRRGLINGHV